MKNLLIEIDKGFCGFYNWLLFGRSIPLTKAIFLSYWIDYYFYQHFSFYYKRWWFYFPVYEGE